MRQCDSPAVVLQLGPFVYLVAIMGTSHDVRASTPLMSTNHGPASRPEGWNATRSKTVDI